MAEHRSDWGDDGRVWSTNGKGATEDRPVVWYAVATCLLGRFPHAGDDERDHRKVREPCVWRRVDDRKDHLGLFSSVHPTSEKEHYRREPDLAVADAHSKVIDVS